MTPYEFYSEMRSKYGFDDGSAVPFGAWIAREKFVHFMNARLPSGKHCPKLKVYDRPGLHNWCMVEWENGEPDIQWVLDILDLMFIDMSIDIRFSDGGDE